MTGSHLCTAQTETCECAPLTCAEMLFRTSLSNIFAGVQSNAMGLYEAGSVGGLVRFQDWDNFG